MSKLNDKELRELLQQSIAPAENTDLKHDLWPRMLQRLDQQSPAPVPWFDWALAGLVGAACLLFPGVIPALAYHF
jgi:hypothetical protein